MPGEDTTSFMPEWSYGLIEISEDVPGLPGLVSARSVQELVALIVVNESQPYQPVSTICLKFRWPVLL